MTAPRATLVGVAVFGFALGALGSAIEHHIESELADRPAPTNQSGRSGAWRTLRASSAPSSLTGGLG
jgi:hypothetical protein